MTHPLSGIVSTWHNHMQAAIGRLMIERPDGFTIQDVVDLVYGDRPATYARQNVSDGVRTLVKSKLEPLGWTIPRAKGNRRNPGVYRLESLP